MSWLGGRWVGLAAAALLPWRLRTRCTSAGCARVAPPMYASPTCSPTQPFALCSFTRGAMTQLFIQRLFSQHCKCFAPSSGGGGYSSSSTQCHRSPPAYAAVAGGSCRAAAGGGDAAAGSRSAAVPLMDFAAFCTFCVAWEQRHVPAAVRYFFQILDLEGKGHLAPVSEAEGERKRGDECHAPVLCGCAGADCLPASLPSQGAAPPT